MKVITRLIIVVVLVAFSTATGCKKEDDKVTNKITIEGNTNADYNKVYTPVDGFYIGPYLVQCVTTTYGTQISINLTPLSSLYMEFILDSNTNAVPDGTFTYSSIECHEGFIAVFYPNTGKKSGVVYMSSGTVSFTKDGDHYDVDLDLVIDSGSGGGTLKGNFHGPIPEGQVK
jgi:hypothetical protein